jgi:hypothetical protein
MTHAPRDDALSGAHCPRRFSRFALAAVATAALCILQLLRQTGTPSWQTIWAEDGSVYSTDALRMGAIDTLFRGYAGYVQFLPRVLALAVNAVPMPRRGSAATSRPWCRSGSRSRPDHRGPSSSRVPDSDEPCQIWLTVRRVSD